MLLLGSSVGKLVSCLFCFLGSYYKTNPKKVLYLFFQPSSLGFNLAAKLLEEDGEFLCEMLQNSGRLDDTYWICAFAVNQHTSICQENPFDRDPFTNELYPTCECKSVKNGDGAASEINKFDDMMHHLAATGSCRQVIAVDHNLELFNRAWCVAEIAAARRLQMKQSLKLASKATLQQRAGTLQNLDVRRMRASSDMDRNSYSTRSGTARTSTSSTKSCKR